MNLNLQNKVIVVSGGAQDILNSIVKVLINEGAIPVIISNKNDEINIDKANSSGKYFKTTAEFTQPNECKKVIDYILNEFGEINGLVNNDTINDYVDIEIGNYDLFMESLQQNLIPFYLLTHYALTALKKSKGVIVNVTLNSVEKDKNNISTYAANGGRNALTREWAVELLKYDIRVNAVIVEDVSLSNKKRINTLRDQPAKHNDLTTQTSFENHLQITNEIANTVAFLLSEKSSHTTGQLIHC